MTEMAAKKLEPGSDYDQYDTDGDGVVTDDELETSKELQELKISNERAQAQRSMSWFALWGMLLYPSLVVVSSWCLFCVSRRYISSVLWGASMVKQRKR